MKKVIIVALIVLAGCAGAVKTDGAKYKAILPKNPQIIIPKGIKTRTITTYKYKKTKDNTYQKIFYHKSVHCYDKNGNAVGWTRYKADGTLSAKTVAEYDEQGNKIKSSVHADWKMLCTKAIYKYDQKGNKIKFELYKSNGKLDHTETYKYDEQGNMVEKYYTLGDMDYTEKHRYKYKFDEKGNFIEKTRYSCSGDESNYYLAHREVYEYDEDGNLIRKASYHGETGLVKGAFIRGTNYKYDMDNNRIKESTPAGKPSTPGGTKTIYKYNDVGLATEVNTYIMHPAKRLIHQFVYEYEFYPEVKDK